MRADRPATGDSAPDRVCSGQLAEEIIKVGQELNQFATEYQ
jgi:hypothetical protein